MYDGDTVAVVVPAYNEAHFVGEVMTTVPDFVDVVIAVDDCSDDGTWQVMRALADADVASVAESPRRVATSDGGRTLTARPQSAGPKIVATRHETNSGRGAAVKTGYLLALNHGVDVVAVMDGDGQMDPSSLAALVDPVVTGDAAYAKGNRLVDRDHVTDMSRWRLFGNGLLTALTKIATGYWDMRDPQNGYTAISATALEQIDVPTLYDGYGFLNDMLVHLGARDLEVADVPMEAVYGEESSGIRYSTFVPRLSLLLLWGFLWRLWVSYVPSVRPISGRVSDADTDE